MTKLIISGALLIVATGAGCGGGMTDLRSAHRAADASHVLVSISVAPATADANNFPNGEVQFTATGKFSDGTTAPIAVMWSAQPPFTTVADFFLLNSSGVGQCIAGGTEGKMTVFATAPADPSLPLSQMTVRTTNVTGTAQLTCP
jgi:hypothetical protein